MRTIVYGNGKSRLKWDLKQNLHDDIITWGCNRIYNDIVVDNLVAMDYWIQHAVYTSGYANKNNCWFADWSVLPKEFDINHMREGWEKIIENDRTEYGCVVNAHHKPPVIGLYIIWVNEEDKVNEVEFPKEWSSGTTAVHLACQKGAKEIYLMGFDMSAKPINNVYEEEQTKTHRSDPHAKMSKVNDMFSDEVVDSIKNHAANAGRLDEITKKLDEMKSNLNARPDWVQQMKMTIKEFSDVQFIWVEPDKRTERLDMNNLTYDTYENIRRKICR